MTENESAASYPSLRDKKVLVTGGGSGIGASLVESFVVQGARVAFVDLDQQESDRLVERLTPGAAYAPVFRQLDLTDLGALAAVVAAIEKETGGIDILINNAARDDRQALESVTPDMWETAMAVNLRHQFFCAQAVVPGMKARGQGVILNMGSASWHFGMETLVLYQTAKAAVEGMTRALARDLGPLGIRVNTIVPGSVQTPRQEKWFSPEMVAHLLGLQSLKARVQPSDVAAIALFLASDDARMITGHHYWVDGGL